MEVLAAFSVPQVLSLAAKALTYAWEQYNTIQGYEEQCRLLIQRCQDLLFAVSKEIQIAGTERLRSMSGQLSALETTCLTVKDTVTKLARKSFMWKLLHQEKIISSLSTAEKAVIDVFEIFNFGAHLSAQRLQLEIADVQSKDQRKMIAHLESLAENDQKILTALQADARGRRRLEELLVALTKHVGALGPPSASTPQEPTEKFIRIAFDSLQRVSKKPAPDVPYWSVTSLEVTFDPEDEDSCIGMGGFGNIYKGEWNGEVVAVKEMYFEDARLLDRQKLKDVEREIKIWSRLVHPRILPFYCACLEATRPFMVTKFCSNGNALQYLRTHPNANRERMLYEVALGMAYLHNQNVVHADIKGTNILISDGGNALITDFGLSHLQDQFATTGSRTRASTYKMAGTLRWMAPELIEGEPLAKPCDVYSFGLLSWELYTGRVPYGEIPERAFARRVVDRQERPSRPEEMGDDIWDMVQSCWAHDPVCRPIFPGLQARLKELAPQDMLPSPPPSSTLSKVSKAPSPQAPLVDLTVPPPYSLGSMSFLDSTNATSWSDDFLQATSPRSKSQTELRPHFATLPKVGRPPEKTETASPSFFNSPNAPGVPPFLPSFSGRPLASHIEPFTGMHCGAVTSVALDEEWIVVACANSSILVFDARTGRYARRLVGHTHGVWNVMLVSKGTLGPRKSSSCGSSPGWGQPKEIALSAGQDHIFKIWEVESGICLHSLTGHSRTIRCMAIVQGEPIALTGSRDHSIRVWDIQRGAARNILSGHRDGVQCLAVHRHTAVSASSDTTVRVWDITSGLCLHTLCGHQDRIRMLDFNGKYIVSGTDEGSVLLWNALTGQFVDAIDDISGKISGVLIADQFVVATNTDGRVVIYDLRAKSLIRRIDAHRAAVPSLHVDMPYLITGSQDGCMMVFEVKTGQYVQHIGNNLAPDSAAWRFACWRNTWVIARSIGSQPVIEIWKT